MGKKIVKSSIERKRPENPWDATKALKYMAMYPKTKRKPEESEEDYQKRFDQVVRVAAMRMRERYSLRSVWKPTTGRGYVYDPIELAQKKEAWIQVKPSGRWGKRK